MEHISLLLKRSSRRIIPLFHWFHLLHSLELTINYIVDCIRYRYRIDTFALLFFPPVLLLKQQSQEYSNNIMSQSSYTGRRQHNFPASHNYQRGTKQSVV